MPWRLAGEPQVAGRCLLQVIYTPGFSTRLPARAYDLPAGWIAGLPGRVTLPEDGAPLVNETIHGCGCDHRFISTARVRPQPESTGEVALARDGVIARRERDAWVYFSPTGIASARQRLEAGRHATTFAGRSHSDDPTPVSRTFEQLP